MSLNRVTITEHDGNIITRMFLSGEKATQVLCSRLKQELGSQVTVSDPESVAVCDTRPQDERERARKFINMVL